MLEFDLRKSKDNIPVLHHDKAFVRTCNHGRFTTDFNFKDYPPLQSLMVVDFSLNVDGTEPFVYKADPKFDSKKINSLEELLIKLEKIDKEKEVWLNLEFKDNDQELIKITCDLIRRYKRSSKCIWGCLNPSMNKILDEYERSGDFKRFANGFEVIKLYALYLTGLLPFANLNF